MSATVIRHSSKLFVDGLNISITIWKHAVSLASPPPTKNILCIHGWLDNSNSFIRLAPYLVNNIATEVCCIDLPGHGHSTHYSGIDLILYFNN